MTAKSSTERARYVFTLKEGADGEPWIALEPSGGNLEICDNGFLGLDLAPNTTYEEALEIEAFLNRHIQQVSFTRHY